MSCLEEMGLSDGQKAAALDRRPRVLVAAGAGSGKTRLLVACFVQALVEDGLPAEQLVAVTFTRKAGAELVSRIRLSLEECGRHDLARSLEAATIGTIHSLCRRLIRERALEAGVDPACAVLEAEAATLVKEEVSRETWDSAVEQADEAELEVFASRGKALREEIVPLYDRLRGMGRDLPQVALSPGPAEEEARSELVALVRAALSAGSDEPRRSKTLDTEMGRLEACLAWMSLPATAHERAADLRATDGFFPSRKTSLELHFEPVRTALTRYRCVLAEVRLRPLVSTVNRLLTEFHRRYEARKQERGLLDFADLELRARALLAGGSGGAAAALPGALVLVDEFQDTNELQCTILEGLGAARLLMVGDERQSIYRFRGADVTVFRLRQEALDRSESEIPAGGVHRLDVNYRSRPEVLAFIDRLFAHEDFFGSRFVPLVPDREGRAPAETHGEPPADGALESPTVEVLVAERRPETNPDAPAASIQEAEAEAVAARIRRLVDDEGWRQRDIVVLMPAHTYVDQYQRSLLARGVEVYVVRGKGYYSQQEVADVTSLLRLLVNPHDDLALVTALRSPLAGVSDDGLYLLGREGRRTKAGSLWEVIRGLGADVLGGEDRGLLDDFVARLTELRHQVGRPGLARLIDDAVSAFFYDVCLLATPEGKRRFANVRKLMRLAGDFEALEGPDLAGFVDLLESMGDLSDREGSAPTLAEGEDVVRVMTVHQAKGLEFPVVVLAGLGSDVPRGNTPEFVIGDDGRMGVFLKGSARKTYEEDDLSWGPAAEIWAEQRAREQEEGVRLLYVAMTRAQERLILVGAGPTDDRLQRCRIGRIMTGLGLKGPPRGGTAVPLEGLDAIVVGVPFSPPGAELTPGPGGTPPVYSGEEPPGACPQFLEVAAPGSVPGRISFSALAAYERCPRQFYLERVLGLALGEKEPAGEEDGPSSPEEILLDEGEQRAGREVGLLVHTLLERLAVEERPPASGHLEAAARQWLAETGVHLPPGDLERALALTLAFWESPFSHRRSTSGAMREAPFFFSQSGVMVTGLMDLFWREEDRWGIVDYKTNALEGRSPAEVALGYEMQAVMYCLAALRAGAPAVQMDFLFLERPREPVTRRFGPEDIPRLEDTLDEALDGLRHARFPSQAGEACGRCPVAGLCARLSGP